MDASEPGKAVAAEAGTHLASTTTLSRGPAAGRSRLLFGHTPRRRAAPPSPAPQDGRSIVVKGFKVFGHFGGSALMQQMQNRSRSQRGLPDFQENADPQKMAFLLRKQWALYSVTPLYKFSYANMKEYSRHLSAFVAAEKQKGLAMVVGIDLSIKVIFSTLLGLKGTDRDQAAILVQIASKTQTTSGKEEEKVVWSGWFCCVFGDELLENVPEDFICLPLFLANGAETYTAIIGTWFQKTFDCCFSRLAISPLNLAWMAAMWTGYKVDSHAVATELIFSVPCIPQRLDISYAIHPEDAQALWDTVQNTQGEVTQEEVDLFMDCLYSHFHRHFKIHLSATRLVKVSTSIASVHSDGNLKILQSKYLIGVLMLLTELAILQIQ